MTKDKNEKKSNNTSNGRRGSGGRRGLGGGGTNNKNNAGDSVGQGRCKSFRSIRANVRHKNNNNTNTKGVQNSKYSYYGQSPPKNNSNNRNYSNDKSNDNGNYNSNTNYNSSSIQDSSNSCGRSNAKRTLSEMSGSKNNDHHHTSSNNNTINNNSTWSNNSNNHKCCITRSNVKTESKMCTRKNGTQNSKLTMTTTNDNKSKNTSKELEPMNAPKRRKLDFSILSRYLPNNLIPSPSKSNVCKSHPSNSYDDDKTEKDDHGTLNKNITNCDTENNNVHSKYSNKCSLNNITKATISTNNNMNKNIVPSQNQSLKTTQNNDNINVITKKRNYQNVLDSNTMITLSHPKLNNQGNGTWSDKVPTDTSSSMIYTKVQRDDESCKIIPSNNNSNTNHVLINGNGVKHSKMMISTKDKDIRSQVDKLYEQSIVQGTSKLSSSSNIASTTACVKSKLQPPQSISSSLSSERQYALHTFKNQSNHINEITDDKVQSTMLSSSSSSSMKRRRRIGSDDHDDEHKKKLFSESKSSNINQTIDLDDCNDLNNFSLTKCTKQSEKHQVSCCHLMQPDEQVAVSTLTLLTNQPQSKSPSLTSTHASIPQQNQSNTDEKTQNNENMLVLHQNKTQENKHFEASIIVMGEEDAPKSIRSSDNYEYANQSQSDVADNKCIFVIANESTDDKQQRDIEASYTTSENKRKQNLGVESAELYDDLVDALTKNDQSSTNLQTKNCIDLSIDCSAKIESVPELFTQVPTPNDETTASTEKKNDCTLQLYSLDEQNKISIPYDMRSSTLLVNKQYIISSVSYDPNTETNKLEDILSIRKSESESMNTNSFLFTFSLVDLLLDAIGFSRKPQDKHTYIRPFPKDKKPTQTSKSIRDFIMAVIDQKHNCKSVLHEISLSFRLVCYFILSSCSRTKRSEKISTKQAKMSELLKRSLLTVFICLRGLIGQLVEKVISHTATNDSKIKGENIEIIKTFLVGEDMISPAEHLLLDIIPLLTDMDSLHGVLGSSKSVALLKHLVKLEKCLMSLNENRKDSSFQNLMEMFMRQLLYQESQGDSLTSLLKDLEHCRQRLSSSGIMACTCPIMTPSCRKVLDNVVVLRTKDLSIMKSFSLQSADDKKIVAVIPGASASSSESCGSYDKIDPIWCLNKSDEATDRYNELHIDGCIYLTMFLDMLTANKVAMLENDDFYAAHLQRNHTVYYLFHTLWENDPFKFHCSAKSLRRRENMKSAVLACLLLAGKIFDSPISLRRLIKLACKVHFPDICYRSDAGIKVIYKYGEPKSSLVKDYESHLLINCFGTLAPLYDHFSFENEIQMLSQRLHIDATATKILKKSLHQIGFTHSSLYLLEDAKIVALSLFQYNCHLGLLKMNSEWSKHFDEDERSAAERISFFISKTVTYVEHKKRRIEQCNSDNLSTQNHSVENIDIRPPDFKQLLENINREFCS